MEVNLGATTRHAEHPRATGDEVLRAEEVRRNYRTAAGEIKVLAGVTLRLRRGELVAVVGPSGCGKSTLLHILAALDTPTSGTVYFAGDPIRAFSDSELAEFRNRSIGFVWQRYHLLADFTAAENVALPLLLRGVSRSEAIGKAQAALDRVGLGDRGGDSVAGLSGGEQQRVAIARALAGEPVILIADEPTGNLDEQSAGAVFDLLEHLHRSEQLTSILATHNLSLARRCDRVLGLEHGVLSPCSTGKGGGAGQDQVTHV